MRNMTGLISGLVGFAALTFGHTLNAQATELTLSSWVPPTHVFVKGVVLPWIQAIESESQGRIKIELLPQPVATAPGHYDAVRDGLVDIAFNSPTYLPGRMPLTIFGQMPFEAGNATAHSVAFERTYTEMIAAKTTEFKEVVYLGSWWSAPGYLWTSSKVIEGLDSIKGLKIRVAGPLAQRIAEGVGAAPIFKPAPEIFELMSGGVVDGVLLPTEAVCGFKVDEVIKHGALVKGGLYSDMFFMMMNSDAWDALTPEDQQIFKKYSGEYLAELAGKAIDAEDAGCMSKLKAGGLIEHQLADDAVEAVKAAVAPALDQWREVARKAGLNPEKILGSYHNQLDALAAK